MLLKRKCTVCGEMVDEATRVGCETCGREIHETCAEFEQSFECPECGDETWIGALEF